MNFTKIYKLWKALYFDLNILCDSAYKTTMEAANARFMNS